MFLRRGAGQAAAAGVGVWMWGGGCVASRQSLDPEPGPWLRPAPCLASVRRARGQSRCAPGCPEEGSGCSVRLRFRAPGAPTRGGGRRHGEAEVLRREAGAGTQWP